LFDPKTEERIL